MRSSDKCGHPSADHLPTQGLLQTPYETVNEQVPMAQTSHILTGMIKVVGRAIRGKLHFTSKVLLLIAG